MHTYTHSYMHVYIHATIHRDILSKSIFLVFVSVSE